MNASLLDPEFPPKMFHLEEGDNVVRILPPKGYRYTRPDVDSLEPIKAHETHEDLIVLDHQRYSWLRKHVSLLGSGPGGPGNINFHFRPDLLANESYQKAFDLYVDKAMNVEQHSDLVMYGAD